MVNGVLSILAAYWPFLLVGWGVLRLVELLSLSMRDEPLPRAGISGSEWALMPIHSPPSAVRARTRLR